MKYLISLAQSGSGYECGFWNGNTGQYEPGEQCETRAEAVARAFVACFSEGREQ